MYELVHSDFDWKKYSKDFVNWVKGRGGVIVKWMKIRWVRFHQGSKSAFVKDTFAVAAPFVEICLSKRGLPHADVYGDRAATYMYSGLQQSNSNFVFKEDVSA